MFKLDSRLHNDTFFVCDLSLCRVLLMNDSQFPWLILVPMKNDIAEIIDLSEEEQITLLKESALASKAMQSLFSPLKLNVAALGNVVRQLPNPFLLLKGFIMQRSPLVYLVLRIHQ